MDLAAWEVEVDEMTVSVRARNRCMGKLYDSAWGVCLTSPEVGFCSHPVSSS